MPPCPPPFALRPIPPDGGRGLSEGSPAAPISRSRGADRDGAARPFAQAGAPRQGTHRQSTNGPSSEPATHRSGCERLRASRRHGRSRPFCRSGRRGSSGDRPTGQRRECPGAPRAGGSWLRRSRGAIPNAAAVRLPGWSRASAHCIRTWRPRSERPAPTPRWRRPVGHIGNPRDGGAAGFDLLTAHADRRLATRARRSGPSKRTLRQGSSLLDPSTAMPRRFRVPRNAWPIRIEPASPACSIGRGRKGIRRSGLGLGLCWA